MISAEGKRQLASFRMISNDLCDGFADARNKPRVLELSNRWVALGIDLFKLVVTVEVDLPA